ncbi:hypothetical protein H4R33_005675 [Dimargaris cristalligena]|uniref:SMP-30/Gluconolactonase/LRE-like region domain-containing protein n=1 Tax=Dimargaris cristalligena TaxID=215637 RepID=A0A4P9ZQD6_9FUNG|nr:hypothetical protein H4R33_005675 [Dimargaris cristalligena]RKP35557.1 hypothetical protein BJ085DRAFT_36835 [Dimargaris cristalligena]|eukprot:RKP35557.1 hypothetical protein BJ085DRAFT_36835 [Dimargaris cristalligena]
MFGPGIAIFVLFWATIAYYLATPLRTLHRAGNVFGNVTQVNVDTCRKLEVPGLEGCEDISIHHPSGLAFMACSPIETRMKWLPPQGRETPVLENDSIFLYDIKFGKLYNLRLENFSGEFKSLGLDVVQSPSSPHTVVVMAVNRASTGSSVEIFDYELPHGDTPQLDGNGRLLSDKLQHRETVQDRLLLPAPNGIYALSDDSFYVTNDHHHRSGLWAAFETITARPWSTVVYRNDQKKLRLAFVGLPAANGIVINHDRTLAYVAVTMDATIRVFRVSPTSGLFHLAETIKLDMYPDNLSQDPVTGQIYVTGPVKAIEYLKYCRKPSLKTTQLAGFKVQQIQNNTAFSRILGVNYEVHDYMVEPGMLLPSGSVAAFDPATRRMLVDVHKCLALNG